MSLNLRLIYLICLVFLMSECKVNKQASTKTSNKSALVIPKNTKKEKEPQYPYHPSETLKNDLLHTKLEVSFDWDKQYLNGLATLKFKPYFYSQDSLILDAKG